MRKWLASKLFAWAVWFDWDEATQAARIIVAVDDSWKAALAPPKKRGRPFGSKNRPKVQDVAVKKRGRPFGSKNKPKVQS